MQDIYIDDIGSGYPLFLVHGYLGSSNMKLQKDYLHKKFKLLHQPYQDLVKALMQNL